MFDKLQRSKKGIVMTWVYILLFIFALGILYSVFLFVFEGHLAPTIRTITNSTIADASQRAIINDGLDKYLVYFKLMPFVLIFVVVIYGIANAIYKQSGGNAYQ